MKNWTLSKLKESIKELSKRGWVSTERIHDTGIGKTLEEFLGIKENNLRLPDLGKIELKAKRIDSDSMLTLATKSPLPKGINKILFEKYKYLYDKKHFNLHSTVCGSKKNPQSFQVVFNDNKLVLKNKYNIKAFWPMEVFENEIKSKSNMIVLVFAETKGKRNSKNEKFHFIEAYLLSGFDMNKFKLAIERDKLKIDIRIGSFKSGKNKGKYHDHGTAFRINKRDFLHLFNTFEQIV